MNNVKLIDSETKYHITDKSWNLTPSVDEFILFDGEQYRVDELLLNYDLGYEAGEEGHTEPISILSVTKIVEAK